MMKSNLSVLTGSDIAGTSAQVGSYSPRPKLDHDPRIFPLGQPGFQENVQLQGQANLPLLRPPTPEFIGSQFSSEQFRRNPPLVSGPSPAYFYSPIRRGKKTRPPLPDVQNNIYQKQTENAPHFTGSQFEPPILASQDEADMEKDLVQPVQEVAEPSKKRKIKIKTPKFLRKKPKNEDSKSIPELQKSPQKRVTFGKSKGKKSINGSTSKPIMKCPPLETTEGLLENEPQLTDVATPKIEEKSSIKKTLTPKFLRRKFKKDEPQSGLVEETEIVSFVHSVEKVENGENSKSRPVMECKPLKTHDTPLALIIEDNEPESTEIKEPLLMQENTKTVPKSKIPVSTSKFLCKNSKDGAEPEVQSDTDCIAFVHSAANHNIIVSSNLPRTEVETSITEKEKHKSIEEKRRHLTGIVTSVPMNQETVNGRYFTPIVAVEKPSDPGPSKIAQPLSVKVVINDSTESQLRDFGTIETKDNLTSSLPYPSPKYDGFRTPMNSRNPSSYSKRSISNSSSMFEIISVLSQSREQNMNIALVIGGIVSLLIASIVAGPLLITATPTPAPSGVQSRSSKPYLPLEHWPLIPFGHRPKRSLNGAVEPPHLSTLEQFSLIFIFPVILFLSAPVFGKFIDKIPRICYFSGLLLTSICQIVYGILLLFDVRLYFLWAMILQGFQGFGLAVVLCVSYALVTHNICNRPRMFPFVMSLFISLSIVGLSFGIPLYQLTTHIGVYCEYWIFGALLLLLALVTTPFMPEQREYMDVLYDSNCSLVRIQCIPSIWVIWACTLVMAVTTGFYMPQIWDNFHMHSVSFEHVLFRFLGFTFIFLIASIIRGLIFAKNMANSVFLMIFGTLVTSGAFLILALTENNHKLPYWAFSVSNILLIIGVSCYSVPLFVKSVFIAKNNNLPHTLRTYSVLSSMFISVYWLGISLGFLLQLYSDHFGRQKSHFVLVGINAFAAFLLLFLGVNFYRSTYGDRGCDPEARRSLLPPHVMENYGSIKSDSEQKLF